MKNNIIDKWTTILPELKDHEKKRDISTMLENQNIYLQKLKEEGITPEETSLSKEELKVEYLRNVLSDKVCKTCDFCFNCFKFEKEKETTCLAWKEKASFNFGEIGKLIRNVYPTMIANDLVSVQPITKNEEKVFYIKPIYTEKEE